MPINDKTLNNIMIDLKNTVKGDISTEEGTLIDHSFRGAAAEFEQAYIGLGIIDQNGYAETADREHLILRAKERGIEPIPASKAIWKAVFNIEIGLNSRFSAGQLTYVCTGVTEEGGYQLTCEQTGTKGNVKQENLIPIEYMEGYESGELTELLKPARDEEETEDLRKRYIMNVSEQKTCSGNRAWYKQTMHQIDGVGACKIYRVTETERRVKIYFLDSLYQVPNDTLVAEIQEAIDPIGSQGEGEGKAPIFHIVDICPCVGQSIEIQADITIDDGYTWETMLPDVESVIDQYFLELAKGWESTDNITVRILRINIAVAGVDGVADIQNTFLNGNEENVILGPNEIPIRGGIMCRQQL